MSHDIQIEVTQQYVPEESDPEKRYYFFSYNVRIRNLGKSPAQLLSRKWIVTNSLGQVEEVQGPGVVGLQPVIPPGQEFEYSSFCPLDTPTGSMRGTYQMSFEDGEEVEVEIPQFYLIEPGSYH